MAVDATDRDPTTYRIIGAYFRVYRVLGWGFLEAVYRKAMVHALRDAGTPVQEEVLIPVYFGRHLVGEYRADIVADGVLVELKAVEKLLPQHRAQVLNYLKATSIERGLLLNFGPKPAFERLVLTNDRKEPRSLQF